jgi:hypothetical protein
MATSGTFERPISIFIEFSPRTREILDFHFPRQLVPQLFLLISLQKFIQLKLVILCVVTAIFLFLK